ncbi:MAG: uracil-DNA glycosylase [Treponema sp.]
MEATNYEILYRFFRTASEYIEGYRCKEPYPQSYNRPIAQKEAAPAAATVHASEAAHEEPARAAAPIHPDSADRTIPTGLETSIPVFTSLQEVYAAVSQCHACGLAATRTHAVAGEGPEELSHLTNSVEVMVIGEGPGADEDRMGRPFVGRAGQLLDKMLEAIQLSRKTNCYITNVVKCRPPGNRDPAPPECDCCEAFLHAQIQCIEPHIILVLGRIAAQRLLQTTDGIGKLRGRFFDYHGIPLMPTYHPSALLRNESLKRPAWEDLKCFRARLLELRTAH